MLTIEYGAEALGQTHFAVSALRTLIDGAHEGAGTSRRPLRDRWWRDARRNVPEHARPLIELINAHPSFVPPFLIPEGHSVSDELETLLATSEQQMQAGLRLYRAAARFPRSPRIVEEMA